MNTTNQIELTEEQLSELAELVILKLNDRAQLGESSLLLPDYLVSKDEAQVLLGKGERAWRALMAKCKSGEETVLQVLESGKPGKARKRQFSRHNIHNYVQELVRRSKEVPGIVQVEEL